MTHQRVEQATDRAEESFWRVRVCLPGSIVHLMSRTEPIVRMRAGRVADVSLTLVTEGAGCGDSVGFIDWPTVIAVTWRQMDQKPRAKEDSND